MTTMIKKIGLSVAVCVALSGNAYGYEEENINTYRTGTVLFEKKLETKLKNGSTKEQFNIYNSGYADAVILVKDKNGNVVQEVIAVNHAPKTTIIGDITRHWEDMINSIGSGISDFRNPMSSSKTSVNLIVPDGGSIEISKNSQEAIKHNIDEASKKIAELIFDKIVDKLPANTIDNKTKTKLMSDLALKESATMIKYFKNGDYSNKAVRDLANDFADTAIAVFSNPDNYHGNSTLVGTIKMKTLLAPEAPGGHVVALKESAELLAFVLNLSGVAFDIQKEQNFVLTPKAQNDKQQIEQPTTPIAKDDKKEEKKKLEKDDGVYDNTLGGETTAIKTTPSGETIAISTEPSGYSHNPNDYKSIGQYDYEALKNFIAKNQDNPMYAEDIKSAKNRIEAIDKEYQKFSNAKTKQELKSYTKNYPNGKWKTEANYKIADIDLKSLGSNPTQKQIDAYKNTYSDPSYRDYTRKAESYRAAAIKTEFNNLKNGGKATQVDYIRFVAAHKGDDNYKKVIQQANYEIAWIDLKAIEANPTQAKIDAFLSKYSDPSYADYRSQASALSGNAEAIAKSKQNNVDRIMAWNKAMSQNTTESYAEYLLHYPNSTNAQEAYDRLAELYGKNPELVSWEPPMYRGKTAYEVYNGAGLSSDEMNQKWNNYLKDKLAEEQEVKNTPTTTPVTEGGGLIETDGSLASLLQGHTFAIPVQDSYQNEQGETICNNHVECLYFGMNNQLEDTWTENGENQKVVLNYVIDGDNVKITGKNAEGDNVNENYSLLNYNLVYSSPTSGSFYNVYLKDGKTTFFGTYNLAYQALVSGGNTCEAEIPVVPPKTDLASLVVGKTFYQKCNDNGNEGISTLTFGTNGKTTINDFGHIAINDYYISGNTLYENGDGAYVEHPLLEQTDTYIKFSDSQGTSTFYFTQAGATNGVTEYCDSDVDSKNYYGEINYINTNSKSDTIYTAYGHIGSYSVDKFNVGYSDADYSPTSTTKTMTQKGRYDYVSWGGWGNGEYVVNSSTGERSPVLAGSYWVADNFTKDAPQSGSASYIGQLYGDNYNSFTKTAQAGSVSGNINLSANFDTENISGNMDIKVNGVNWGSANFSHHIDGGGVEFSSGMNADYAAEAWITGTLTGPNAEEIGGNFHIRNEGDAPTHAGEGVIGVYAAKQSSGTSDLAGLLAGKTVYQKCNDNGNEAISTLTLGTDGKMIINDFGHVETYPYYFTNNSIFVWTNEDNGKYVEYPLLEQTDTYVKFGDDDVGTSTFYFTQTGATHGVTEYCDSEIDIPTNTQTAGMANFMFVSRSTNNAGVTADFATYRDTHIDRVTDNTLWLPTPTGAEAEGFTNVGGGGDVPAIRKGNYDYTSWGSWGETQSIYTKSTGEISPIQAGSWVYVSEITKDLPQSGSASYTGKLYGDYLEPDDKIINAGVVGGNIGLNANFGTKNITGNMDVTVSGSNWATANFNLPIQSVGGGHGFNGNLNTANAEEARIGGVFAGPNATEIGGQFTINHGAGASDNGTVVGVFGAKKD